MRTVRLWTSASACLLAVSAFGAEPLLTSKLSPGLSLSNVADPATVARTRLFMSGDGGKTWSVAQEIRLDTPAKAPIRFQPRFERDGTYAIYTCTDYRDGRIEAEPKPGVLPAMAVLLTIDTTAPTVNRFDATLSGRAAAKAVVRATWSVGDAHLGTEPVAVEASTDGGAHFTVIHHGQADGGTELTIPVAPDTKELQLRLAITDRAGNAAVSPARVLTMQDVPAPTAPAPAPAPATVAPPTVPTPPTPIAAAPTATAPAAPVPAVPSATPPAPAAPIAATPTPPAATAAPTPPVPTTPAAAPVPATPEPAPPSDPIAALAKAAKNLPTLDAVGATPPKPLPTTPIPPAVPTAAPTAAPVAAKTPVPAPTPALTPVPASPVVAAPAAAKAPDVVAVVPDKPEKTEPAIVAKTAPPVVAPAAPPAATVAAPAPKPAAPPKPAPVPKAPAHPPTNDGTRPAPAAPDGNYLSTATAQQLLDNARDLVRLGNVDDACDVYERLRQSAFAKTALLEEVQLLNRNARPNDARMIAASASIEQVSDSLRLEHGKALVAVGRQADAQRVLSGVRGNAPESRPALLLIARCALTLGQDADARNALEFLARGNDAQAADARELLQRLDNR